MRRGLQVLDAVEAQTHPALAVLDEVEVDEHRAIEARMERALEQLRLLWAIEAHRMKRDEPEFLAHRVGVCPSPGLRPAVQRCRRRAHLPLASRQRHPAGTLAPAGYLDAFKNAELQVSGLVDVGYGMLGADDNFALTGDRRIATVGFQQLDANFLYLQREPGGACFGDSGGPILLQSGGVEYVVGNVHGLHIKFNSNVKQDCTGDFPAQRMDLRSVLDFIQSNIATHGP